MADFPSRSKTLFAVGLKTVTQYTMIVLLYFRPGHLGECGKTVASSCDIKIIFDSLMNHKKRQEEVKFPFSICARSVKKIGKGGPSRIYTVNIIDWLIG
jgi:hypothetical protein